MRFLLAPRSMTLDDLEVVYEFELSGISRDFADLGSHNGYTNEDN